MSLLQLSTAATSIVSGGGDTKVKKGQQDTKLIKCHKPFESPINPIVEPKYDLSEEQLAIYNEVLEHFEEYITTDIPVSDRKNETQTHPILEEELAWLTKECFLRYLRATKWKKEHAIIRIKDSILWRRTFGVVVVPGTDTKPITAESVEVENETGKNLIVGYDNDNRPCLYLRNGYQNTSPSIRQVQHLVFMLERVIQFMPPGQDTLALLIDLKAAPEHLKLLAKLPSLSISKQVLHILQHHYPERLGKGLFTNLGTFGHVFLKMAGPFIDPYTRLKTIYDQPFEEYVPKEQLDKEFNGLLDFEYDHDIYWPEMNKMAERKHQIYMDNFKRLGGKIGHSEFILRSPIST
ncbi:uncharacterized protein KQ657_003253 [Scheffersomyces spartinae]|uniref:CRAL-TRIO domain-containing protein n=1 Tax=Scheffersomyces spartinae TaxID=45513 RepID=A0A9P7VCE7_9ASCO|nr:uncharacterized protein KQ657_003253 [Scheffersomyces spartinae]KAG7195490.1 hypothetical protein KQ657_003253 [Scheffersomyces spartinae]